jgi:hypothetical protein
VDPTVTSLPDIDGELGEVIKEKDALIVRTYYLLTFLIRMCF